MTPVMDQDMSIPGPCYEVGMVRVGQPAPPTVEQAGHHLVGAVPLGPHLVAVRHHNLFNQLRCLVWNNSDGELTSHLHRHDMGESRIIEEAN